MRAWYGRLYIISSFPRPQGCRRRTLRRKRGLESPPVLYLARFFFCAARTFSFLISAGAALRNPFLPSFSPAVPSFFYLMALRSATSESRLSRARKRATDDLTEKWKPFYSYFSRRLVSPQTLQNDAFKWSRLQRDDSASSILGGVYGWPWQPRKRLINPAASIIPGIQTRGRTHARRRMLCACTYRVCQ